MRRIVLPFVAAPDVVDSVTAINIRVAVEVVIVIDVDIVATPAGAPSPTAAPGCAHCESDTK